MSISNRKKANTSINNTILIIGLVLSFSIGFIDTLISVLLEKPAAYSSFAAMFLPLSIDIVIFFIVFLILLLIFGRLTGKHSQFQKFSFALSLAVLMLAAFTLGTLLNCLHVSLSTNDFIRLCFTITISTIISIGMYLFLKYIKDSFNYQDTILRFAFIISLVIAASILFVWYFIYQGNSLILTILVSAAFILFISSAVWFSNRIGQRGKALGIIIIIILCILVYPIGSMVSPKRFHDSYSGLIKENKFIKNVILLTVDTLRPDFLSCYQKGEANTPNIDKLAEDGILFENAYSAAAWTLPAFSSIMTGYPPLVHMAIKRWSRVSDNFKTLAEYMEQDGYRTNAIGSNPFLKAEHNLDQGFAEYHLFPRPYIGHSFGSRILRNLFPEKFEPDISTSMLTQLAIKWINSNAQNNIFLWLHYFDPHDPYTPPPEFYPHKKKPNEMNKYFTIKDVQRIRSGYFDPSLDQRDWIESLYNGEVDYVDNEIGKFLNVLKELKIYNESLIIFTSDHGEEFFEHGGVHHGHSLYNEIIHVPLIIKLPKSSDEANKKTVGNAVSTQSLLPTILDLCRIEQKDESLSVSSLRPLWRENNGDYYNAKPLISTGLCFYEDRESVIFDNMKYIRFFSSDKDELYNLSDDPHEKYSLAGLLHDKVKQAKTILNEQHEKANSFREKFEVLNEKKNLDEESIKMLKSLGYIR